MGKISRKLDLFVSNLRHFRQRPLEILTKGIAHRVKLESNLLDVMSRGAPAQTAHQRCRAQPSDKGSAIHSASTENSLWKRPSSPAHPRPVPTPHPCTA